jgi:hypothetical protein
MMKSIDILFTVLLVIYYGYYCLLGFAFGGLSGENPAMFVLLTIGGIAVILTSLFAKRTKQFILLRLIGILLLPALILFDLIHSINFSNMDMGTWINIFTYSPILILLIYTIVSILRIRLIMRYNS